METRSKGGSKEKDYHHGDLRHALIQAALLQLETDGAEELTLRELARKVGVSHTAPYRHFPDKKALLLELAEGGFKELLASLPPLDQIPASDSRARFRGIATAYVRFGLKHPALLSLMFGSEISDRCTPETLPSAKALLELVIRVVVEGQAAGAFGEGDPMMQAVASWSLVHGLSMLLIHRRLQETGLEDVPPESLVNAFTEIFMRGLGPRQA